MNWNQAEREVTSTLEDHEGRMKRLEEELNAMKMLVQTTLAQKNTAQYIFIGIVVFAGQVAIAWFFKK